MVLSQLRAPVTKIMSPLYVFLAKIGIHPNMITIAGLGLGIIGGWALAANVYLVAALAIMLSGFLDMLDGGVARASGYSSNEGAFLDSVCDRLGESAIYIGLIIGLHNSIAQLVGLCLLVFSLLISYLRARGEGLGVNLAGIGIMERPERMTALFIASLLAIRFQEFVFFVALSIILALVVITTIHRFVKVYDALKLTNTPLV